MSHDLYVCPLLLLNRGHCYAVSTKIVITRDSCHHFPRLFLHFFMSSNFLCAVSFHSLFVCSALSRVKCFHLTYKIHTSWFIVLVWMPYTGVNCSRMKAMHCVFCTCVKVILCSYWTREIFGNLWSLLMLMVVDYLLWNVAYSLGWLV